LLGIDISKKSLKNRYWRSVKGAEELQEQRRRGDEELHSPPHPCSVSEACPERSQRAEPPFSLPLVNVTPRCDRLPFLHSA